MIRNLRVDRFKSLVNLDIELGRLNVFIGANGSGKSNLLEAIGVLGAAASGRIDDEALLRRGVRPGVPKLYKSAFPVEGRGLNNDIGFGATSDKEARYDVTLWNPNEDPSVGWSFKTETLRRTPDEILVSRSPSSKAGYNPEQGLAALTTVELVAPDAALSLIDELRLFSIYCPNTPTLRGLESESTGRVPVGLSGSRLAEAIEELEEASKGNEVLSDLLGEVLDLIDWAESFRSAASKEMPLSASAARSPLVVQFVDRFMAEGRNKLSGYDASEGGLYILFCAVLALHPRAPRCLAVDNIDQALNPLLAKALMRAICRWNSTLNGGKQWLMTAHNPAVLDGLPLQDPEVRLFTVDRNNEGHTIVSRIDLEKALKLRPDESWTLSRMWVNGYLGGVPNV